MACIQALNQGILLNSNPSFTFHCSPPVTGDGCSCASDWKRISAVCLLLWALSSDMELWRDTWCWRVSIKQAASNMCRQQPSQQLCLNFFFFSFKLWNLSCAKVNKIHSKDEISADFHPTLDFVEILLFKQSMIITKNGGEKKCYIWFVNDLNCNINTGFTHSLTPRRDQKVFWFFTPLNQWSPTRFKTDCLTEPTGRRVKTTRVRLDWSNALISLGCGADKHGHEKNAHITSLAKV